MLNKVTSAAARAKASSENARSLSETGLRQHRTGRRGRNGGLPPGPRTQEKTGSDLHRTPDKSDDSVKRESTVRVSQGGEQGVGG